MDMLNFSYDNLKNKQYNTLALATTIGVPKFSDIFLDKVNAAFASNDVAYQKSKQKDFTPDLAVVDEESEIFYKSEINRLIRVIKVNKYLDLD